jgi:light-regulated signal transduction histidine kinase (bacteriophytochrome)
MTIESGAMTTSHMSPAPDDRADIIERELTEFSYIVSHDLAAPCRHLSHFARLLLRDMGPELTESQRTYGNQIQAAGERCQMMLEQLLLFSRVQTCQLTRAAHDAASLAKAALLQLSRDVHEANAEVSIGPMGTIHGDGNLLTIVFKELILNGIRFHKPDQPCRLRVSAEPGRDRWVGCVVDNGIGLSAAYHEKAFRMFWRLSADASVQGVGAGLAICRRIVRRHGGEVQFRPSLTDGTCVEVVLPVPPAKVDD